MLIHFYSDRLQGLPPPLSFLLFSMSREANPSGWFIWTLSLHGYLSTGVSQGVIPQGVIISWWFVCCPHISSRTVATHRGFLSCFSSLGSRNTIVLLSFRLRTWWWPAFLGLQVSLFVCLNFYYLLCLLRSLCLCIVSVEFSHLDW